MPSAWSKHVEVRCTHRKPSVHYNSVFMRAPDQCNGLSYSVCVFHNGKSPVVTPLAPLCLHPSSLRPLQGSDACSKSTWVIGTLVNDVAYLKVNVSSWMPQHVLLCPVILQGGSIQTEEPQIPLLVQKACQPGTRAFAVLVEVPAHQQSLATC